MTDLDTGYKIATSIVVVCFILTIGLVITMVGRHYFNTTIDEFEKPALEIDDANIYFLSQHESAVPVASLWKVVQKLEYKNIGEFYLRIWDPSKVSNQYTYIYGYNSTHAKSDTIGRADSSKANKLENVLAEKCYFSWEYKDDKGYYVLDVTLVAHPTFDVADIQGRVA